jgi:2-succinyl-6-hydroxy-2,4-cyclohexadiene-1-carboxylate synthase
VPTLERSDASLAYEQTGEGPPVTLLHGFTQRGDAWRELVGLMPSTHRWITPDLRGHGATRTAGGAAHSMDACAADVVALWDSLGVERAHLAGYSMGGRLALHVAVHAPTRIRSVAVIGAHAGLEGAEREKRRSADEALAARIERDGSTWFARHWAGLPIFASLRQRREDLDAALAAMRSANDPHGIASSLRDMGAGVAPPLWARLGGVQAPVLILAGADDARYVAYGRRLCASLPRAQLEVVADAGHAAHLEQPAAVAEAFARFLATVDGEST